MQSVQKLTNGADAQDKDRQTMRPVVFRCREKLIALVLLR
jgi:hypothetical protein